LNVRNLHSWIRFCYTRKVSFINGYASWFLEFIFGSPPSYLRTNWAKFCTWKSSDLSRKKFCIQIRSFICPDPRRVRIWIRITRSMTRIMELKITFPPIMDLIMDRIITKINVFSIFFFLSNLHYFAKIWSEMPLKYNKKNRRLLRINFRILGHWTAVIDCDGPYPYHNSINKICGAFFLQFIQICSNKA